MNNDVLSLLEMMLTFGQILAVGYKKDIFGIIEYEFELLHKSRRKPCISSIPQELHIIKTKFCISSLRKEMQPAADDIHLR